MADRPKPKTERKKWILLGAILAILLMLLLWRQFQPNPMIRATNRLADAVMTQDTNALMGFMHSREGTCSGLTPEKFEPIWKELVGDQIRASKLQSRSWPDQSSSPSQASTDLLLRREDGSQWSLSFVVNDSDEGPKMPLVVTAMMLGSPEGTSQSEAARQRYMTRVKAVLRRNGVEKLLLNPRSCVSLDDFERLYVTLRKE